MLTLLIARHGNTFDKGDTVLRVGRGTDLPLSNSGKQQAMLLGQYLKEHHPDIATVYTSTLRRTIETAEFALKILGKDLNVQQSSLFDEIDYGPDEGKPETEVIARLGQEALDLWDKENIAPEDWQVDPKQLYINWCTFANELKNTHQNKTVLVVTSNGIARFAPEHNIKLRTGAISCLKIDNNQWQQVYTNHKPDLTMA